MVLFGPWSCLPGLTFRLVTLISPLGLPLNVTFYSRACLFRNLGRNRCLKIGNPLFRVMVSPVMSSLILLLIGLDLFLLTPSREESVVIVGGLRYLCMTLVPVLVGALGM